MTSSKSNGVKLLSLTELHAQPMPFEDVAVPEYGDGATVRVHAVTGTRRSELSDLGEKNASPGDNLRFVHEVVAAALGDGATADSVGTLPSTVIDRLGEAALRMAGLGRDADKKAEARLKVVPSDGNG